MKYINRFILLLLIVTANVSCDEIIFSDEFLSQTPEQVGFSIDSMFSSQNNADRVLTKAYSLNRFPLFIDHHPGSVNGPGRSTWMAVTDFGINYKPSGAVQYYYSGTFSPTDYDNNGSFKWGLYTYPGPWSANNDEDAWDAIRYSYIFLNNIDRVPDMSDQQKEARKGEARVIIAMRYFEMLQNLGGVPWLDQAYNPADVGDFERETVESMVDRIVELLDLATAELPWKNNSTGDYGRYTKASAMGLKVKVLLFAASPVFNDNEPYHPDAGQHRYLWYGDYNVERWRRAEQAAQEFIQELNSNGGYSMAQPSGDTHKDYREAFIAGYHTRGTGESLMNLMPVKENGNVVTEWGDEIGFYQLFFYRQEAPTMEYINIFPMADGSDFPSDFDWSNPPFDPFFDASGNHIRDPRLYETANVNGDYLAGETAELWSEGNGFPKGKHLNNNNYTAFQIRKYILERNAATSQNKPIKVSYLRLPEIFLSYAESINEANGGPNATAYDMVNRVRNRVGLPDLQPGLSQEEFREAVLRERALEFGYENGIAWFDIVRWKQEDRLKKTLHGLNIFKTSTPNIYEYSLYELPTRHWMTNWDTKWYFSPFPQSEVDKGYGLVQNPGW